MINRSFFSSFIGACLLFLTFAEQSWSKDSEQNSTHGERIALTCVACHGANGKSTNSLWPNLAAQKKDYLSKQLHDFKSAKRENQMMQPMTQTLSDEDIEVLAKYFSEMKP